MRFLTLVTGLTRKVTGRNRCISNKFNVRSINDTPAEYHENQWYQVERMSRNYFQLSALVTSTEWDLRFMWQ